MAAAIVLGACTSEPSDRSGATGPPSVSTTTVPTPAECEQLALDAVVPLRELIDRYDSMSFTEWNELETRPDATDAFEQLTSRAQAVVERGCDAEVVEGRIAEAVAALDGEGLVGKSIARALRGEGPLFGPPPPVDSTKGHRNLVPTTVTVRPGEPLGPVLGRLAPGSTVMFAAGVHRFTESIVIDVPVSFVGEPRGGTVLSSTAIGAAVAAFAVDGVIMRDLVLEHTGDSPASVMLIVDAAVELYDVTVTGGSGVEDGGGNGIVAGNAGLAGLGEATAGSGSTVELSSTVVDGSEGAGILATGDSRITIDDSTVSANGSCGICATEDAAVALSQTTVEGNELGVQGEDRTSVDIDGGTVRANRSAGVTVAGDAALDVSAVVVEENGAVGIQLVDTTAGVIGDVTVRGHDVGLLLGGETVVEISASRIVGHGVAVQADGRASVSLSESSLWLADNVAVSLTGDAVGDIRGNLVERVAGTAIQVAGRASATVADNDVSGDGAVGVGFLEASSGAAVGNRIRDRQFGIQVAGTARTDVIDNEVRATQTTGILFADSAYGAVERNRVERDAVGESETGIMVVGSASPTLLENVVRRHAVGLVIRGTSQASSLGDVVERSGVGVQVLDQAEPRLAGLAVRDSTQAGVLYADDAAGSMIDATLTANGDVGISVSGAAAPDISRSGVVGPGRIGVGWSGAATGEFRSNRIEGVEVGARIGDQAVPQLYDNVFGAIASIGMGYFDSSGGENRGNRCDDALLFGITVAETAVPNIGDNDCLVVAS